MDFKDYYKIMGVDENATPDDIKKAYKKLARRFHPDVSKEADAEQQFKEVGEAYEVLRDAEKRREYDQLRKMGVAGRNGQFTPPPGWEAATHFYEQEGHSSDFSDFFEALFGRNGSFRRSEAGMRMRGEDLHSELALLLEEAWQGSEQTVAIRVPESDEHGLLSHRVRKLKVKVPPGTGDGSVLRIKGQGTPGLGGGSAGDLLLTIRLAQHPLYVVDGKNLSLVVPLAPWEAVLGCKLTVPTLAGKRLVTIPPDSQNGQKLRLAGLGMPGKPPGDFFLVLKVVVPATSTDKARALYDQLRQESGFNPRAAWEDKS